MKVQKFKDNKQKRKVRVRSRIFGTSDKPRLSVFRSNKHIYGQLIDDSLGRTLASAYDHAGSKDSESKVDRAFKAGQDLAKKAFEAGIRKAVFDRGSFKYHGRVKAFAEGAREKGLKF